MPSSESNHDNDSRAKPRRSRPSRSSPDAPASGEQMRVAFVASEAAPFAKTGGLADVAGSLPRALAEAGIDVTLYLPLYRSVRNSLIELSPLQPSSITVPLGPHQVSVGLEGATLPGSSVRVVFLRYDPYFDRDELYGSGGRDYPDNSQRFSLFARAVPAAANALSLSPDIYHLNDWQTALLSAYLKTTEAERNESAAKTVLTIHNIAYQGIFWKWDLPWTGLSWDLFTIGGIEFYSNINFLKAGIEYADVITTVSPTYAREIQTVAGSGLETALRGRNKDLVGILNGIDASVWNPATDTLIHTNYSADDLSGKAKCKQSLQRGLGLAENADAPLIGSIGRLVELKGIDLLLEVAGDLFETQSDCQLVVLGKGEVWIEEALAELADRWPDNVRVKVEFDEKLAHAIEAGSDIFVMPSQYEPCGLNQLYSMTYGTIPVVRKTGGLADSVDDVGPAKTSQGTGFVFDEFTPKAFSGAIGRAVKAYRNKKRWKQIVQTAMNRDWSWGRSAAEYAELYRRVMSKPMPQRRDIGFPKAGLRP